MNIPCCNAPHSQPNGSPLPGLFSKPHIPAPSTTHTSRWASQPELGYPSWDTQGNGVDLLCRYHSLLPAMIQLFCSFISLWKSFSVLAYLSTVKRSLSVWKLLSFSSIPGAQVPLYFLSSSFFSFQPTWSYGDLSCPFRSLTSSASAQYVFCENFSVCRCMRDVFFWKICIPYSTPPPSFLLYLLIYFFYTVVYIS